jgi:hypothetical protein
VEKLIRGAVDELKILLGEGHRKAA